jgi:hypothetical protein
MVRLAEDALTADFVLGVTLKVVPSAEADSGKKEPAGWPD